MQQQADVKRTQGTAASPPTTFIGFLKGMGPGIVVVLSWLGTGDFITSAVSGSTYGYALIWALVLAVGSRYFIVSTMSKYQLCNKVGDATILQGYRRVWKGFPTFVGVTTSVLGFVYVSFLLVAAGTALAHLVAPLVTFGEWGTAIFAALTAVAAIILAFIKGKHYRALEILGQVTMAALVICFLIALFNTGVDFGGLVRGLAFKLPEGGDGYITAITVSIGLIGAVGGSAANLLYPYLMREKGWSGTKFRKMQSFDLITGSLVMLGIVLAVWVVAAETLHGTGAAVDSEQGLVLMMERAIGPAGPTLMWLAIFFVVFDNIVTQPRVFVQILVEAIHGSHPERAERMRVRFPDHTKDENERDDPIFRIVVLFIMIVPIVFSLPFGPDLVLITLIGNGLAVVTVPFLMVGLIIVSARKDLMPTKYVNRWWENFILLIIGVIGLWATYELILSLVGTF